MEHFDDNQIRIANKDIRTYLGQCYKKMSKYNTIILSFGESFAEKGRTIANIIGAIGIKINKSNLNESYGNLKFGRQETDIINQKTGKRENKIFYQITLNKMEGLQIEDINGYEFLDLKKAKIIKDEGDCKNEIKLADAGLDFYLGQCSLDFQSHDQLVLSTTAENIELIKYMIKILNPLGVEIDGEYLDRDTKKIIFHVIEKERINPKSGRKERTMFYKLGLTKVPDLFMYTNPNKAVEVE